MPRHNYFYGLDVLRGLSAIFIVLYHYTVRFNENPITASNAISWPVSINWGCAAVTSFFILSGFLSGKYIKASRESIFPFLKKRFIRLFPAFFVSVVITSIVTYLFLPAAFCGIKDILLNFTMVPNLFGARYVDGAYWTLQYEWAFYFVVTIIMLFPWKNIKYIILTLWIVFSIVCNICYDIIPYSGVISTIACTRHSQEFVIGVSLYYIINNKDYKLPIITSILCIINQIICQDLVHFIFFMITLIFILISVIPSVEIVCQNHLFKPILLISNISYPLYLIHQMVGFSVLYNVVEITSCRSWILIIIPILVVFALAWIIHNYIEVPLSKVLDK